MAKIRGRWPELAVADMLDAQLAVSRQDLAGAARHLDDAIKKDPGLLSIADKDEREAVAAIRKEKLHDLCRQWFEYGEYLVVEIDTEAKTCTVVPVKP